MRISILDAVSVLGMGLVAMAFRTTEARTAPVVEGCGGIFCVSACPAYPDKFCESYKCAGGGCSAQKCGSVDYTVDCEEKDPGG